ncbi:replicative DNA helicase [Parasphingorhabdus sp.]|jgi:replicative DNA helicase|uniref:replicative DNA helicase n=1 Tax=Parasphingorhabdus sp. TaxID=2709688 RepID=UPI0032EF6A41
MAELMRFQNDESEGQRLPRNVEAEATFLGALLIDNRVAEDVQIRLRPEHFYEPLHGRIYEQALKLLDKNMVATPVTLKPYFEADEAMRALGGPSYLAKLTGDGAGLIGARDFANQIYDLALLRELVSVGRTLVESALDTSETVDPKEQIEEAETALYRVSEGEAQEGGVRSFLQASTEALNNVERAFNSGGKVSGITTGLTDVNAKMGGLHRSDLLILAGRPGMGKTSLATNIAFNAANRYRRDIEDGIAPEDSLGAKTAFFSLEMSADQLATRILSEQAEISSEKLRMGAISRDDMHRLAMASRELQDLPLFIDDTPALTIAALRTRARRLQRRQGIGLIVVDYLQLLQGSGRANDNRVNEISEISRGLKTLAKELQVPVMALSQLSRAVESREDKRPQLSDLRESGSIEQDADIVMFIFRDEYYHLAIRPDQPDGNSTPEQIAKYSAWEADHQSKVNKATVIVAKNRQGSTGNINLSFLSEFTKFGDLAYDEGPEEY